MSGHIPQSLALDGGELKAFGEGAFGILLEFSCKLQQCLRCKGVEVLC